MLIVSHAPHCLNCHYFVLVWYTVLVSLLDNHVSVKIDNACKKLRRMTASDRGGAGRGICRLL